MDCPSSGYWWGFGASLGFAATASRGSSTRRGLGQSQGLQILCLLTRLYLISGDDSGFVKDKFEGSYAFLTLTPINAPDKNLLTFSIGLRPRINAQEGRLPPADTMDERSLL